jgi:hypothetical protein
MQLNRLIGIGALCLGGLQVAAAQEPPTTEEAQAAYSRFATTLVGRLIAAGLPAKLSDGKFSELNEFAHRQPLRGCDERREIEPDPFAPADAPAPPVVFHCTWESGERISLTRVPNTGTWMVSDQATAAAGAGMLPVGPQVEAPRVAAIPTAPIKPPAPADVPAAPAAEAVATAPPPMTYSGANLRAMPSPFIPPARAEPVRSSAPAATALAPMPTPFAAGTRQ